MQNLGDINVKFFLSFLLTFCFSANAFSINNSGFSDLELLEASPFVSDNQARALNDVLRLFDRDIDEDIPLPEVLISEDVSLENTELIEALESQGMPAWALERGINMYLVSINTIILGRDQKIHNLAHEYAHYVQVKYVGHAQFSENLEYQAVNIQNNFRD